MYPATLKKLEDVSSQIHAKVLQQKSQAEYEKYATQAKHSFINKNFDKNEFVITSMQLNLNSTRSSISYQNIMDVFELEKIGNSTPIFRTQDGRLAFFVLRKIIAPEKEMTRDEKEKITYSLKRMMQSLVERDLIKYLHSKYPVEVKGGVFDNQ